MTWWPWRAAVYPRPHGEAALQGLRALPRDGLSPPTRGSRRPRGRCGRGSRSIPAHTGKPRTWPPAKRRRRVYPRPHGEARLGRGGHVLEDGLSPPTRGSQAGAFAEIPAGGSIPAHTGKPTVAPLSGSVGTVYPRPHGEAGPSARMSAIDRGLSPPTRGSPWRPGTGRSSARSIPAHTGKPRRGRRRGRVPEVYPRPHGEACAEVEDTLVTRGLSPPTRGSRRPWRTPPACRRSIPAHTGKPRPPPRP